MIILLLIFAATHAFDLSDFRILVMQKMEDGERADELEYKTSLLSGSLRKDGDQISFLQVNPSSPYESIPSDFQRMENYWMNQCVTASIGSKTLMKSNDPTRSKYGQR